MTMSKKQKRKKQNQRLSVPLAPPPIMMKSRKKARQITSLFHQLSHQQDAANKRGDVDEVQRCQLRLSEMGGRQAYQRASQLSTLFHSTSKWVLRVLAKRGWLHGIVESVDNETLQQQQQQQQQQLESSTTTTTTQQQQQKQSEQTPQKQRRRATRLLEVGAINKELLDAAITTTNNNNYHHHRLLQVKAIDLSSTTLDDRIEQADFLTKPILHRTVSLRYDVVVCSMVVNCVPTPEQRGTMLCRLFHQLRPGGLCFLTLPKLCLTQSPYLTPQRFQSLLVDGIGFLLQETKESPKIAFFVLQRPPSLLLPLPPLDGKSLGNLQQWMLTMKVINRGKKFRNLFAVVLHQDDVSGNNLNF